MFIINYSSRFFAGDSMPQTSTQTSILSVYLSAMMAISAMSVILTSFILRIYHKPEEKLPPGYLTGLTRGLRKLLCLSNRNAVTPIPTHVTGMDGVLIKSRANTFCSIASLGENFSWKMIAETLDAFFFVFFTALTVLISVPCLVTMATGAN